MLKDKSSCCSHHIPLFLPLTHSHISAVNNMAPSYWDSQKKWYCRIIPTPRGLRQSIIQHCQPVARFVYVMIYWIQLLLFFFFPFSFFLPTDKFIEFLTDGLTQSCVTAGWHTSLRCESENLFTCVCVCGAELSWAVISLTEDLI